MKHDYLNIHVVSIDNNNFLAQYDFNSWAHVMEFNENQFVNLFAEAPPVISIRSANYHSR